MEHSTARKLAAIRVAFQAAVLAALGAFVGVFALMLVAMICFHSESGLARAVLYALQKRVLWPSGVFLDDQRWTAWLANVEIAIMIVAQASWMAGAVAAVFLSRKRLRRSFESAMEGYKPGDYPACSQCWYNLTGNETGICPECGTPIRRDPNQIFAFPADTKS